MTFKKGDYVVFTEKKIEIMLDTIKKNAPGAFTEEKRKKNIDELRKRIFIFSVFLREKEFFIAKLNERTYNLKINDVRLATLKEKREFDLSKLYK
jgi:hypothetical protein